MADIRSLAAAAQATLAAARLNPTPETREAARVASQLHSDALVAAGKLPKQGRPSCRAGKRQAAERRAMYPSR